MYNGVWCEDVTDKRGRRRRMWYLESEIVTCHDETSGGREGEV